MKLTQVIQLLALVGIVAAKTSTYSNTSFVPYGSGFFYDDQIFFDIVVPNSGFTDLYFATPEFDVAGYCFDPDSFSGVYSPSNVPLSFNITSYADLYSTTIAVNFIGDDRFVNISAVGSLTANYSEFIGVFLVGLDNLPEPIVKRAAQGFFVTITATSSEPLSSYMTSSITTFGSSITSSATTSISSNSSTTSSTTTFTSGSFTTSSTNTSDLSTISSASIAVSSAVSSADSIVTISGSSTTSSTKTSSSSTTASNMASGSLTTSSGMDPSFSMNSLITTSSSSLDIIASTSSPSPYPITTALSSSADTIATISGFSTNSSATIFALTSNSTGIFISTDIATITSCYYMSCVTLAPVTVSTETATSTTLVTITSCSRNICSATVVATGITCVTINSTTYTTYCPINSIVCTECTPISTTIVKTQTYTKTINDQTVTKKVMYTTTECNYYTTVYLAGKPDSAAPTSIVPTTSTTAPIVISTFGAPTISPTATFQGSGSRITGSIFAAFAILLSLCCYNW